MSLRKRSYRIRAVAKALLNQFKPADDFDWRLYHQHYRGELQAIERVHTLVLSPGDYAMDGDSLVPRRDVLPLHPNHRLLYETIGQLSPKSATEFGCGGGDHIHNLGVLFPELDLRGYDLSERQLDLARERHPEMKAPLEQVDITLPLAAHVPRTSVAYTQAVLMHLQTGNNHLVALWNLFRLAEDHVVLMENWTRHEFKRDIERMHQLGLIEWKEVHFHYRESPELRKPHLMVVSRTPLDYPVLEDYEVLRTAAATSQ